MKLKTFYNLLTGKIDIRATKKYNELFGKKCIFIEKPHAFFDEIQNYISKNKPREIFILTPENYEDMIKPEFPNVSKEEFEKYFNKVLEIAKKENIKVILHVHICRDSWNVPFEEKFERTKKALEYLINKMVRVKEVGYGWWRISHKDRDLKKIANMLGLELSKRRAHIYDWWLK